MKYKNNSNRLVSFIVTITAQQAYKMEIGL